MLIKITIYWAFVRKKPDYKSDYQININPRKKKSS